MKAVLLVILGLCAVSIGASPSGAPEPAAMYPALTSYVAARVTEFDQIGP
jgi:hypothetical protein